MKNRFPLAQAVLLFVSLLLVFLYPGVMILPFVLWLLPIVVAMNLGYSRDRTGWMWGLFLGWLGVLILAIMKPIPPPVKTREIGGRHVRDYS